MRIHRTNGTKTLSIVLAAGLAGTVAAAPDATNHDGKKDRAHHAAPGAQTSAKSSMQDGRITRDRAMANSFARASTLLGSDVQNTHNETIATVEDFVFDRGSGKVEHVVLRTGAVMGFGGKAVAIPYADLTYNTTDEQFWSMRTEDEIKNSAKFVPDNWIELDRQAWSGESDWLGDLFDSDESDKPMDEWAPKVRESSKTQIEGEVLAVRRSDWINGTEYLTIVLKDGSETHSVLAGPSWYFVGMDNAPKEGDRINATIAELSENAGYRKVLISSEIDGRTMTFRDKDGKGRWHNVSSSQYDTTPRRLVLMSDLIGARAQATGQEEVGEIQDVVIETNSGRIAFVGFDPNENVLGLGDTILGVPWGVVNLTGTDEVRVVTDQATMERCPELPDDLSTLTNEQRRSMYRVFGIEPVMFDADGQMRREGDRPRGG